MRRLSQLIEALGSPAALLAVGRLLSGPATQKQLLEAITAAGVQGRQPRLSLLLRKLELLGLLERDSQKSPYRLRHRDNVAAAVLHFAALGAALAEEESAAVKGLEDLARRTRIQLAESESFSPEA